MENQKAPAIEQQESQQDPYNIRAPGVLPERKSPRWTSLDIARGIAIFLMILSHCVKGLLHNSMIPDWGNIPVHLLTKFSSSLFILVFGVSISLFFVPLIKTNRWKKKKWWMIKRGVELMFWYKILTVVQMFQFYPKPMIIETLLFKRMPDFVEILSFYAIALVWLPFFLPVWSRLNLWAKAILTVGIFSLGQWLHFHFDFWGLDPLKAILVENDGFYTFGQFQRGALIFLGLMVGDLYKLGQQERFPLKRVPLACVGLGLAGLVTFYFNNSEKFHNALELIAANTGKHPPDINFSLFSLGGAFVVLGLSMLMNQTWRKLLKPVSYLGQHSLNAFILHIIIIFYLYRYYFDLHHNVTYMQSLGLTGACVIGIIFSMYFWNKTKTVFA